jgi:DNA-binding NarL/FixJ family response regulator
MTSAAPSDDEIPVRLAASEYEWARELALSMTGLNCTVSDVIRLALGELRDRHPSPKKLEEALRRHVWQERTARSPRIRPRTPPPPPTPETSSIRVLLVHGNRTVRAGLAGLLAEDPDMDVVGEVGDGKAAIASARRRHPDVAIIDVWVAAADVLAAIGSIRPAVHVMVLASPSDRELVLAAAKAGAVGHLPSDAGPDELVRGIRAAARGESSGGLKAALALLFDGAAGARSPSALTRREREVLALVGRGLANKQIAGRLGISEKTVKAHLGRAFQRIGVNDRTQAALWAERNGLLGAGP